MKRSRRIAWWLLLVGVGVFLALVFRAFILDNVVMPVAVMLVLFWRLVLSVHQAVYWGALIFLAVCLAFWRLAQVMELDSDTPPATPATLWESIRYWRLALQLGTPAHTPAAASLKRELAHLLVALQAAGQSVAPSHALYEALRLRQKPLPEAVYAYLFSDDAAEARPSWRQRLARLAAWPGQYLRRWTGRERAEYYRSIDEALTFMEAVMEIKHDADECDPPNH